MKAVYCQFCYTLLKINLIFIQMETIIQTCSTCSYLGVNQNKCNNDK